jgi:hypothetical protein
VTNSLTQIRGAFFSAVDTFDSSTRVALAERSGRDIQLEFASTPRDDISRLDLAMFNRRHFRNDATPDAASRRRSSPGEAHRQENHSEP